MNEACCTCATLLRDTKVPYDPDSEKPIVLDRRLDCCGRTICAGCQYRNERFRSYCPFCQISSGGEGSLPREGLRFPPSYSSAPKRNNDDDNGAGAESSMRTSMAGAQQSGEDLPSYRDATTTTTGSSSQSRHNTSQLSSSSSSSPSTTQQSHPPASDTIHHLSPNDTLPSLSLLYTTPLPILRAHNNFPISGTSDFLLPARKVVSIPAAYYTGPNLSTPPDPEVEERKNKIRKVMVATKCVDYSVATLYLKGAEWVVEDAVRLLVDDERWERENPLGSSAGMGRGRGRDSNGEMRERERERRKKSWSGVGGGLVGQLS